MVKNIDWKEFKVYKATSMKEQDNFMALLDFLKSYYNLYSVADIYETLKNDDTATMMLNKRNIKDAEGIEGYLFKEL